MALRRLLPPALLVLGCALLLGLLRPPARVEDADALARGTEAAERPPPRLLGRGPPSGGPAPTAPAAASASATRPSAAPASGHAALCELHGRALGPGGEPLPGVRVRVRRAGGHWQDATHATDASGRYRHVTRETGSWRAALEIDGLGTARAGPVEVPGPGVFTLPDLCLAGEGVVAGRVAFRDGSPAGGIPVVARLDRRRGGRGAEGTVPGLVRGTATTDEQGRFGIRGLRPGWFVVEAPDGTSGGGTANAATGGEEVLLVLDLHRMRIRVCDPRGRALPAADLGMRWVDQAFRPIGRASVLETDGSKSLWLSPGRRLIVAGHAPGHTVAEAEVLVPTTPLSCDVDLVLRPCGDATGTLRVLLTDERGRAWPRFAVVLLSPLARSRLDRGRDHVPDRDGLIRGLVPGAFEMSVWPRGTGEADGDGASYHVPVRTRVTIRPREETRLELCSRIGGRVLVREAWTHPEAQDDLEAYVRFERPGHPPLRPMWLDPEDEDISPILEGGVWILVLHGEGVQEVRRTFRVEPGRTRVEAFTIAPE